MTWWEDPTESFTARTRVVIVGSGAGGAVAAVTLAEAGLDVIVVEEGHHRAPPGMPAAGSLAMKRYWQEGGMRTMNGRPPTPLPGGRGLGGSTLINSAICFRTPESVLDEWNHLSGGTFQDPEEYYRIQDEVEGCLMVRLTPDVLLSGNDRAHKSAAEALGWSNHNFRRNTPACAGCGRCNTGCPVGGKWSVDKVFLPRAHQAGARILTGCKVDEVAPGRVAGSVLDPEGLLLGRFSVDADVVILAGGAVATPRLLMDSGLVPANGPVGEGLAVHPSAGAFGLLPERATGAGATQGHYIDHFLEDGTLLEACIIPPGMIFAYQPFSGLDARTFMKKVAHIATTGSQIRDRSRGQILPSRGPGARVRYSIEEEDRVLLIRGVRRCAQLWIEGGQAEGVMIGVYGSPLCHSMDDVITHTPLDLPANRLITYASHPQSTCGLGRATESDGRVKGVEGVYCMDASVLPSNVGRNPQISIMTTVRLLAMRLAQELGADISPLWTGAAPPVRMPQPGAVTALGGAPDKMREEAEAVRTAPPVGALPVL